MRKSYSRLVIFDIILVIILLLNSFMLSILNNYYYMIIFLGLLLVIFKLLFGFEKDNHRYIKDIILNILIIFLTSFIIYYILGIFIGFVRTDNYYTLYGIGTFIIPYILMIILKEFLRYQILNKSGNSKILIIVTCLIFILLDICNNINVKSLTDSYSIFIFIALTILPAISNNIVCTYIAKKIGYKPNIFWLIVANMYGSLLPIVPDTGLYIGSLIRFLFPMVLLYNIYSFFQKRTRNVPISYEKKIDYIGLPIVAVVVFVLAYFVSGYFRYYAIAVATGSMKPNINVGDVVIIDQQFKYEDLKIGQVIAYKYDNIIVVHRICDIAKVKEEYYFYTKGDANNAMDNYIIYPDTIVGVVNTRIPFVGLPTVWLNEL